MSTVALIAAGEKLGLTDDALRQWVDAKEREERAFQREEREAAKEQAQAARELAIAEQRTLELKLQLREQNESAASVQSGAAAPVQSGAGPVHSPQRWMPPFDERRDDLDAYIMRFERLAVGQQWPTEQWATALSVCLSGEALAVFARLTPEDSVSYEKVKRALLTRFRLTAEGFREKFRASKPEAGETGTQYVARLSSLFDRWVDLAEVRKEYKELRELIIGEQFTKSSHPRLVQFLRERKHESLAEMAEIADRFLEAQEPVGAMRTRLEKRIPKGSAICKGRGKSR